jgi:4-hydroxythreonine-4-phosphate dehydrogenase
MGTRNMLGITMGDPAGIGPEVICKALAAMSTEGRVATIVIGDPHYMRRAATLVGVDAIFVENGGAVPSGKVRLEAVPAKNRDAIRDGIQSGAAGEAAFQCVKRGVEMALRGDIDVIVTASLNKAALREAGYPYNGHTGALAHLCGVDTSYAVLACPQLSVIHVTTHVSLSKAAELCRVEKILRTIRAGYHHVLSTGIRNPRIAVSALNPHAGEGGMFGTEDDEFVVPAVAAARDEGMDVTGPVPGDVVFSQAVDGKYDLVVAQFHDQGHIPAKLLGRHETVNVTAGLPILRTSVDHGTAFDIAWKGVADPQNMQAAIRMARTMRPVGK